MSLKLFFALVLTLFSLLIKDSLAIPLCAYTIPSQKALADCQWYNNDMSCCSYQSSQQIQQEWKGQAGSFQNATVSQFITAALSNTVLASCTNQLHMFICFHCTPSQANYITPNIFGVLSGQDYNMYVCESYCESMYKACQTLPTGNGLVGNVYSDAQTFCTQYLAPLVKDFQIQVGNNPLTGNCFNGASALSPSSILQLLVFMLVLFFLLF
jgi:hypothetical protein